MTQTELLNQVHAAEELIKSWPEWKKGALENSSQSTVPVPRKPIVSQVDTSSQTEHSQRGRRQ